MSIVLNGTTGITTPHIDSTGGLDAADLTGALPALDGSALTGIESSPFKYDAVSGASQALNVGDYNFFSSGQLSADTTVSFSNVPTTAKWQYSYLGGGATGSETMNGAALSADNLGLGDSSYGVAFNSNGTKFYSVSPGLIKQYSLSTAWVLSTGSLDLSFDVSAQDAASYNILFNSDGTRMFMTGFYGGGASTYKYIHRYDLSTAYDLNTASYSTRIAYGQHGYVMAFGSNGTKLFQVTSGGFLRRYSLPTAYDLTGGSYDGVESQLGDTTWGLAFSTDGRKMFTTTSTSIREYALPVAWDQRNATITHTFDVFPKLTGAKGITWGENGTQMVIADSTAKSATSLSAATQNSLTLPSSIRNAAGLESAGPGQQCIYTFTTEDGGINVTSIAQDIV